MLANSIKNQIKLRHILNIIEAYIYICMYIYLYISIYIPFLLTPSQVVKSYTDNRGVARTSASVSYMERIQLLQFDHAIVQVQKKLQVHRISNFGH